jgi:PhoH-like ATPase
MSGKKKVFVLDTNVILHDSSCIYQFQENDVLVPITVIEELDGFKKGSGSLNFHAREFVRALDALSAHKLFNGGLPIGPGLGNMMVRFEQDFHPDIAGMFSRKQADHAILNTAYCYSKDHEDKQVILVSKDVNLRMKAKAIGLMAEDYTTDHVTDLSAFDRGYRTIEDVPAEMIADLYGAKGEVDPSGLDLEEPLVPNEFLVIKSTSSSALVTFMPGTGMLRRVHKESAYGINPRNAEQTFALDALTNDDLQLVTLSGKAGTGKTLLALAAALQCRRQYRQIFLARPVVPLSNKDIGFLPGDIESKLNPYMQPLYDNLGVIKNQFPENSEKFQKISDLMTQDKLKIAPLAYIRGRSLVKIYFIVDEAQNLTPHEVKTIITRAGAGTKLVFTGDIYQIDHPYLNQESNGLTYLIEKMQGQSLYAHINLVKGERSELAELASNLL